MVRFSLRITLLLVLSFLPWIASAQSPRKVVVEEFTNASSAASFNQDQVFQWKYISNVEHLANIVPIIYHTNFPGNDAINATQPEMHNGRTAYYGGTTVPIVRVNGKIPASTGVSYAGAPIDTAAISAAVAADAGTMSPITITIDHTVQGTTINGKVTVSSTEALTGKRVYIVAVDLLAIFRNAGLHSIDEYYFIPWKMFPDYNGSDLTLAAGEKKEIPITYPSTTYDADYTYFAAFVQDTATKEILQAEQSIVVADITSDLPDAVVHQDVAPQTWNTSIATSATGNYGVTVLTSLPDGWSYHVKSNGVEYSTGDSAALQVGAVIPMTVEIDPTTTSPRRTGFVIVILQGPRGYSGSRVFRLYSGKIETLTMMLDDNTPGIDRPIESSLDTIGGSYAQLNSGDRGLFDLSKYILLVTTGKQSVTGNDISMLKTALDGGGRLLLNGAEIGYSLGDPGNTSTTVPRDTAFLHNYLHADYIADNSNVFTVQGVAGDPVGNGLDFSISDGIATQDAPDVIAPRGGAQTAFYYGTDMQNAAAVRYADSRNRIIYMGFGIEGIGNDQTRTDVLRKSIEWLRGQSGVAAQGSNAAAALGAPWPNPVARTLSIPLVLEHAGHASLALYDTRGERVAPIADRSLEAGPNTLRFDCSALPAGAYRVVVTFAGEVHTALVNVVR